MGKTFESFRFTGFDLDRKRGRISLAYGLDGRVEFTEILEFDPLQIDWQTVNESALHSAMTALHLAGGVSYFKTFCPPVMTVETAALCPEQARFWSAFYTKGLAQFFHTNGLDPTRTVSFPSSPAASAASSRIPLQEKALLPIGGGKDSIVSGELMKRSDVPATAFSVNNPCAIQASARGLGLRHIWFNRRLSPRLFELNAQGALNGHVPITGYISCVLAVAAILLRHRYICMSLERGADSPQVISQGMPINHQYSKGLEFENAFREYLQLHISPDIEYFSLLRPFHELRIASIFSRMSLEREAGGAGDKNWLDTFRSCNSNFRQADCRGDGGWCGVCPKCAFVFLILAPFVPQPRLTRVFGSDLLAAGGLTTLYRELLGLTPARPFECIGTVEETRAAFWMIHRRPEYRQSASVQMFVREALPQTTDPQRLSDEVMESHPAPNIPEKFWELLRAV